jgi:hypothetical protein
MLKIIAIVGSPDNYTAVFSNDTYAPVVNLFDADGDLTPHLNEAVSAVAGPLPPRPGRKTPGWVAFELPDPVTIH